MAVIITRTGKGAPLTHAEMDANLNNLNNQITIHEAAADPHPQYETSTEAQAKVDAHKNLTGTNVHGLGSAALSTVTTSTTDTTVGRLLKVGDFGVGAAAAPSSLVDIDSTTLGAGFYRYDSAVTTSGTLPPGSTFGALCIARLNATAHVQIALDWTSSKMFFRYRNTTVFGAWAEIFHKQNILGTVSQSSGVPTGAVIERGSNSNGEYVKFADGTMICTIPNIAVSATSATEATKAVTFPATFSASPIVTTTFGSVSVTYNFVNDFLVVSAVSTTSTSFRLRASVTQTYNMNMIVIGRWF